MENRNSKYLKYAIGEIILVVIGILIALSINNWNQTRQNTDTLKRYTSQLIEEVDLNITKLNTVITEEGKLKILLDSLVEILEIRDYENPELIRKSYALLSFEDFHPETIAFENLKSSGEFKLIDDIDLRNSISEAYNTFEQVRLTHDVHYYNMKTRVADYFMDNANFIHPEEPTTNFGRDRQFGNLVLASAATIEQKINACKSSLEKMEALKTKLEDFKLNGL